MKKAHSNCELYSESKQLDHEIKLLHQQIALAEKSFASLIKNFTNISVDVMRLQSRENDLTLSLSHIASEESPTMRTCLLAISEHIKSVADSNAKYASVIQEHMLKLMSDSVVKCKKTRQDVGDCSTAKKKVAANLKKLEKEESKSRRRSSLSKPKESELRVQNEALEVTKQIHELESSVEQFERSKVESMREWLKLYIHSSLAYHVKAVEEFTKAYQSLSLIDIEDHVSHLNDKLYPMESNNRLNIVRWNSFNSLNDGK